MSQQPRIANTVDEAAERLRISRSAIYNLIAIGALKSIKVGKRRLVPESELQAMVARLLEAAQ